MLWLAIVLLGVLAIVSMITKRYQFLLLFGSAAIVSIGHLFGSFGSIEVLFWILWAALLLVAILAASRLATFTAISAFVAAVVIVLTPVGGFIATNSTMVAAANPSGAQAKQDAPAGTGNTPATCEAKFVQKWADNPEWRLSADGLYIRANIVDLNDGIAKQHELAGRDARYLAAAGWTEGLWNDPNNVVPLLTSDKGCLSTEGQQLYKKLTEKWDSAVKTEIADAPADGVNTGSDNGKFVINHAPGVTGDRRAVKRTYADGTSTYYMFRCGQPVLHGSPHGVPVGNTDQHPKTETTPSHSTTTVATTTPSIPTTETTTPSTSTSTSTTTTETTPSTSTTTTTPSTSTTETTPSTSTTETTPSTSTTETTPPKSSGPFPSGKPTAGSHTASADPTATSLSQPADPTDHSGDPVVSTTRELPSETQTQAADPTDPATGSGNPDGAFLFLLPGLFGAGGLLAQRKLEQMKNKK